MPRLRHEPPPPTYDFAYGDPPRPGNEINGLGETTPRRAQPIFHGSGATRLEWEALEGLFAFSCSFKIFWLNVVNRWIMRQGNGPVAKDKTAVDDPAAMAVTIKEAARRFGAGIVGVAPVTPEALYDGYETDLSSALVIGTPHRREPMAGVPDGPSAVEAMRAYSDISRTVVRLAKHIRAMGWRAVAYSESADILHIPLAISAGLGELGKHGSLITLEYGSSLRLASVLTDMPLTPDAPNDFGVDDLCLTCRRCTQDCPPDAISDAKQIVRGETKWYVDFDKCIPYFTKTEGCGICLEVCPWTEPGRGPELSRRLLAKREKG